MDGIFPQYSTQKGFSTFLHTHTHTHTKLKIKYFFKKEKEKNF
jgi:hypothetical protein